MTLEAPWGLSQALRSILEPDTTLSVSEPEEPSEAATGDQAPAGYILPVSFS